MKRVAFLLGVIVAVACSPSDPEAKHTSFPACEDIAVACHNFGLLTDGGDPEACHRLGHLSTTNEACEAKHDFCVAYCESDGGVDGSFEAGLLK